MERNRHSIEAQPATKVIDWRGIVDCLQQRAPQSATTETKVLKDATPPIP
jgi:hypothetical protein